MHKFTEYRRELRGVVGRPVAYQLRDGYGATLAPVLERIMRGERAHHADLLPALLDGHDDDGVATLDQLYAQAEKLAAPMIIPAGKGGKATALLSVFGTALYATELQPIAFSTLLLGQTITALANDPEIGTIVLDIDSPGGVVTGVPEAADAIFAARQTTNVVALVNPLAASAAYYLASQANEIVAVPSADVGSLGVFMVHANCSGFMEQMGVKTTFIFAGEHKIEGNSFEALSDESREYFQSEVDSIYTDFVKAVARGRGVSTAKVLADFGQGRTMMAKQAKAAGMIDRVATLGQALTRWGVSMQTIRGRRRGETVGEGVEVAAEDKAILQIEDIARAFEIPADMLQSVTSEDAPEDDAAPQPEPEPAAAEDGAVRSDAASSPNHHRRLARLRYG